MLLNLYDVSIVKIVLLFVIKTCIVKLITPVNAASQIQDSFGV